jgi:hypothetical protein
MILLTHLLRWWIAVADFIIHSVNLGTMVYAKCVDNLYIVANTNIVILIDYVNREFIELI